MSGQRQRTAAGQSKLCDALVPKTTHSSSLFELRFRSNNLKPSVTPVGSCTWPHTSTRHNRSGIAGCLWHFVQPKHSLLASGICRWPYRTPLPSSSHVFTDVDRPGTLSRHFQVRFPSICAGRVIRIMPYGQVHCTLISGRNLKDQDLFGKMGKDNRTPFSSTMPLSSLLHFCRVLLFLQIRIAMCSARPD